MKRPWWLTKGGWEGFWIAFRASFDVAYHGGTIDQGADAANLAVFRHMKAENPDLTWHEFWALTHPNERGSK